MIYLPSLQGKYLYMYMCCSDWKNAIDVWNDFRWGVSQTLLLCTVYWWCRILVSPWKPFFGGVSVGIQIQWNWLQLQPQANQGLLGAHSLLTLWCLSWVLWKLSMKICCNDMRSHNFHKTVLFISIRTGAYETQSQKQINMQHVENRYVSVFIDSDQVVKRYLQI